MSRPSIWFCAALPLLVIALPIFAQPVVPLTPQPVLPQPPDEANFQVLDTIEGHWINLNHAPLRPMVASADWGALYAVNTHDSTVVHFSGYTPQPVGRFRVPWSPVAVALWDDPNDVPEPGRLLVVCRGTYGLAVMKRNDGTILDFIQLQAEPGDIAVIGNDAYVACSGADSVQKIDLVTRSVTATFAIPSKHPLFLTRDGNDVLVTPQFSGNNTVVHKVDNARARFAEERGILDLSDPTIATIALPDEDVFRISSAGTVTPEATGVGTILFGHAINPVTGELWVLNTEANNTGKLENNIALGVTTEPAIRGIIGQNRLTRIDLATGTKTITELDQRNPDSTIDPGKTTGQPFQVSFIPAGLPRQGFAFVVGLLNDRVTVLNSSGAFLLRWDLPAGSLPRGILYDPLNDRVLVYCWGTNEIRVYSLGPVSLDVAMDLGHDPAPLDVQEGRKTFYDASHSLYNNASCATCHVDGRMDMEEWDLSNDPKDNKGPLITQTLSGIARMKPFHWRGEQMRGLIDFNGAFDALLGGTPLDETNGQFDRFQAFTESIQSPANPYMDPRRIINNAFSPPLPNLLPPNFTASEPADAVEGQDLWFNFPSVGAFPCNFCHTLPTGTKADVIGDGSLSLHPKRSMLMITGFNAMWRKIQDLVLVDIINEGQFRYPLLGGGFAHSGASNNLLEFTSPTSFDDQQVFDVSAFQAMLDTGTAPAAHDGTHFDQGSFAAAGNHIATYLIPEADQGDCDVVVFGTVDVGGTQRSVRWAYDRSIQLFVPELDSVGNQPWSFFVNQTLSGLAANVFMGVPPGMGFRFGIDFDADGLPNGEETAVWGTDPLTVDFDGDGFEDGHEVDNGSDPTNPASTPNDVIDPTISGLTLVWRNARQAKLRWETSEPTKYALSFSAPEHDPDDVTGDDFATVHNVVLSDLLPSTNGTGPDIIYTGTLTVTDRGNRSINVPMPAIDTRNFVGAGNANRVIVSDLFWQQPILWAANNSAVSAQADATVLSKFEVPNNPAATDVVLIARVLIHRNGQPEAEVSSSFTSSLRFDSFTVGSGSNPPPLFLTGPFLMSTGTGSQGEVSFAFSQGGLNPGDEVILNIEAAATLPAVYPPASGDPNFDTINRWSMPDTQAGFRCLRLP